MSAADKHHAAARKHGRRPFAPRLRGQLLRESAILVHKRHVSTTHASVAVTDTEGAGMPVLLIHGNSTCKEVFRHQVDRFGTDYRILAIDLPGHGDSSDALDPYRTYSMPGYASCIVETLEQLEVQRPVVFGWSLGGHIGLELLPLVPLAGLVLCGTPPVGKGADKVSLGFRPHKHMTTAGKADLTPAEIDDYAHSTCGDRAPFEPFLQRAVARTHGLARELMCKALISPEATDQRQIAESSPVPLAIINGADDAFIDVEYITTLSYRALWTGAVHNLADLGHAPFWEAPDVFNSLLAQFLGEISSKETSGFYVEKQNLI